MRKFILFIVIVLSLVVVALALTPWHSVLESKIRKTLTASGFSPVSLRVTGIGLHGVAIEDLQLGADAVLRFQNVNLSYNLQGLRQNKLDTLTVIGPRVQMHESPQGWGIQGAEGLFVADENASPRTVASLTALLQVLPFEVIAVSEGILTIRGNDLDAGLPLDGRYDKAQGRITYQGDQASFRKGAISARMDALKATLLWDGAAQQWQGDWSADNIVVQGAGADVPVLKAAGTMHAGGTTLRLDGALQSADRAYHINFSYEYFLEPGKAPLLTLHDANMPWKQGRLKLGAVKWPLDGVPRDLSLNVRAENISVGELLGAVTGQRVQATGTISGNVPLTLKANGDIELHNGSLIAAAPGKIMLPPDAIPGDNEKIKLVRDILANLDYSNLAIRMNSDQNNDLGILMTVEGRNPAIYDGRAVKLNVNLTGDVLDFIRQNVMLLTRPEALWEQENVQPTTP